MNAKKLGLGTRARYLFLRVKGFNFGSVWSRARDVAKEHNRSTFGVFVDMLWSAGFRNTAFQDYVDFEFATLNRKERATYMTHSLSNHLAMTYDDPKYRELFHDKIEFNRVFDEFLGREWLDVRESSADGVRDFFERHRTVVAKEPFSNSGHGVHRHLYEDVSDWDAFYEELKRSGQSLIEENIKQHPTLAEVCPGTANTTRITTFFDGDRTHVLSMAQKFGRGTVSDQQTYGGFYTMLNLDGSARGAGYDSHGNVHATHPESGVSIPDFQLPMVQEMFDFIDRVARTVPQMQYVGWDVVITADGPVLVEGNWAAGVYENKPSVTGIRTGSLPRFREAIGF